MKTIRIKLVTGLQASSTPSGKPQVQISLQDIEGLTKLTDKNGVENHFKLILTPKQFIKGCFRNKKLYADDYEKYYDSERDEFTEAFDELGTSFMEGKAVGDIFLARVGGAYILNEKSELVKKGEAQVGDKRFYTKNHLRSENDNMVVFVKPTEKEIETTIRIELEEERKNMNSKRTVTFDDLEDEFENEQQETM